jgi:hypothetical protein
MILDLEIQEEGEWFHFFSSHIDQLTGDVVYDDPVTDAKMKIRGITPFIERKMIARKKQVERVYNPKSRAMERIAFYPDLTPEENIKEREETWDYLIQDWVGFADKKTGRDIPCTKENKTKLMKIPVFDRYIARCLQLLSESGVEEAAKETKNSLAGSNSQTTKFDPE